MSEQETLASSSKDTASPISWWVRLCRWLWRVLLFVWTTLMVAIVGGTIANLNTTATDTPLTKLYFIHVSITYPLPTIASIGTLVLLTILSRIGSRGHDATVPRSPSQQNRLHLLQRLHLTYDTHLTDSLEGITWLELGLASNPKAVQNTSRLLFRTPHQPECLLPAGTSIVEVYTQANGEFLILGEPGAGKSTLLLHLAQHLVTQAEQNSTYPLPVILPLSTWAVKRAALDLWLVEQLWEFYHIPRSLAQQWVEHDQILPLLDGLDEMEELLARPASLPSMPIKVNTLFLWPCVVVAANTKSPPPTNNLLSKTLW